MSARLPIWSLLMKHQKSVRQFVICIKNQGYVASLEKLKIYRIMPDPHAIEHKWIRVIDESGEGYLYPRDYFVPIKLPQIVVKTLAVAA